MRRDFLKVLVVGSGARESALVWSLNKSDRVGIILSAPGNGGTHHAFQRDVKEVDIDGIVALAKAEAVDLVVVGPEGPLVAGLVDLLAACDINAVGPSKLAARLEGSKIYTKSVCDHLGIPTARWTHSTNFYEARRLIEEWPHGVPVIKADGLCGGKGVFIPKTKAEAIATAELLLVKRTLGPAGDAIVIEERLEGRECSLIALCDGQGAVMLPLARDYKRAFEGDHGPNTGGMGSYSPAPVVTPAVHARAMREIILPTVRGMEKDGIPYTGFLYAGIMITDEGPKLLEYNVRLGDPETQVILPLIESDLVEYFVASTHLGGLKHLPPLHVANKAAVCVVIASDGYPGKYETGKRFEVGLPDMRALCFAAGLKREDGALVTSGGRVMSVVGVGKDHESARKSAYATAREVHFDNKFYREDIAAGI